MFDFNRATAEVEGWLSETEGHFLYNTARTIKTGNSIVEVGSTLHPFKIYITLS